MEIAYDHLSALAADELLYDDPDLLLVEEEGHANIAWGDTPPLLLQTGSVSPLPRLGEGGRIG